MVQQQEHELTSEKLTERTEQGVNEVQKLSVRTLQNLYYLLFYCIKLMRMN